MTALSLPCDWWQFEPKRGENDENWHIFLGEKNIIYIFLQNRIAG